MKAIATKQPTNESVKQNKSGEKGRSRSISPLSTGMPLLQRQCACGGGCPRCQDELGIQTKLKIGEPGDKYEQEADRIANEVMRMPEPSVSKLSQIQTKTTPKPSFTPVKTGLLQRKCACGNSASLTGKSTECENKRLTLQRRSADRDEVSEVPPIVHEVLRSPGTPLNAAPRTFMEPRFSRDFSSVRVHTDSKAAQSAQAVNALAYTVGRDIVFGHSQYTPQTQEGQRLLAHELTHVVQQANNVPGQHGQITLSKLGDSTETEADEAARLIVKGESIQAAHQSIAARLQRQSVIDDPIHQPIIENFRREQGLPLSGVDEFGQQVGPSDAEIKYGLIGNQGGAPPGSSTPTNPCPTSVRVGSVAPFNHSNLSTTDKDQFGTYLGAVSRMDVGPGPNHSGHCMREQLRLQSNTCPAALTQATQPCSRSDCLPIDRFGSAGDALTRTTLTDGPTAFIDLHRTRNRRSLLEGTGVSSCSIACEQTYSCNGTQATGSFQITRNFVAGTHTRADGTSMHITTGTVTKT